ncbi:MAG: hypothetical protein Q7T80_13795 [Methanoregula sp.]|nr:hypothetical protein [Methanoregula sp.]
MQLRKIVTALPALLLAGLVFGPCVSASDNATSGSQDTIIIQMSISNKASEKSDLNETTGPTIKPLNPVPVSNLKKITVPNPIESAETQIEIFSDRDWAFIRKSMTDLTKKEQDQLFTDWKKILNKRSSLSPDEQQWVSMKMGNFLINATEGGKPVTLPDRPGSTTEKPVPAAAIPLTVPFIAIVGLGIIRLLLLRDK